MTKRKRHPGGRPPAWMAGEKSSTYPNVRIEPTALAGLKTIAAARGVPLWQVMSEAARLMIKTTK